MRLNKNVTNKKSVCQNQIKSALEDYGIDKQAKSLFEKNAENEYAKQLKKCKNAGNNTAYCKNSSKLIFEENGGNMKKLVEIAEKSASKEVNQV